MFGPRLQEDKEPLFDTIDTVESCLQIATGVVATMVPNPGELSFTGPTVP